MQIDTLWMKTNFMRFNTQYFDGVLPLPRLRAGERRAGDVPNYTTLRFL